MRQNSEENRNDITGTAFAQLKPCKPRARINFIISKISIETRKHLGNLELVVVAVRVIDTNGRDINDEGLEREWIGVDIVNLACVAEMVDAGQL